MLRLSTKGVVLAASLLASSVLASRAMAAEEGAPEAPPFPEPPRGVACVVYGRGTGVDGSCGEPHMTEVAQGRDGARPMARFRPHQVDVAWGIYPGRGRGWVHVEDGTFILDGFADLGAETFALRREVEVVREHVWLKHGAPVHVTGADRDGVSVRVDDLVEGVNDVSSRVPCEALLFDPPPEEAAAPPGVAVVPAPEITLPRFSTLSLHAAPGGALVTKLRTREEQLPLFLDVVERKDAWTHVRFETDRARFDVWTPTSEVDSDVGSGIGLSGLGCCGVGIGTSSHPSVILQKTPVTIGAFPTGAPATGLAFVEGARVHVVSRRGRFVQVEPAESGIMPPEGKKFWVPASAVD